MATLKRAKLPVDVFEDGDAVIAAAKRAFRKAAKAAVAENDRLGMTTHGAVNGKLVERKLNLLTVGVPPAQPDHD